MSEPEPIEIKEDQGIFYFHQGNVRFPMDPDRSVGVVKSVQVLDKLNRGTWLALAQLNHLSVNPFNEDMLKPLLMGIVQLAWHRRFKAGDKTIEKLEQNQAQRVAKYNQDIQTIKDKPEKAPKAPKDPNAPKSARVSQEYCTIKGAELSKYGGQLRLILDAMRELAKPVAVSEVVAKIKDQLKTKQPPERVVGYYFSEGQKLGIIRVVPITEVADETARLEGEKKNYKPPTAKVEEPAKPEPKAKTKKSKAKEKKADAA
jgi:hypothetical protein